MKIVSFPVHLWKVFSRERLLVKGLIQQRKILSDLRFTEAYLEAYQTSMMELFWEKELIYFYTVLIYYLTIDTYLTIAATYLIINIFLSTQEQIFPEFLNFFFAQGRSLIFLNFMKAGPNRTNTTLTEVWLWHSSS